MKKKYAKNDIGILVKLIKKRKYFRFFTNAMSSVQYSMKQLGYNESEWTYESFYYSWFKEEHNRKKEKIIEACKYQLSMLGELTGESQKN